MIESLKYAIFKTPFLKTVFQTVDKAPSCEGAFLVS